MTNAYTNVDSEEIRKFGKIALRWWDRNGDLKKINQNPQGMTVSTDMTRYRIQKG